MDNLAIDKTIEYIKKFFKNDFSGHDYYHSLRVYRNAVKIAKAENADIHIVALAALLHDVDDYKLSPDTTASMKNARDFLRSINACDDEIDAICSIITQISFKGTDTVISDTAEGRCVQELTDLMRLALLVLPELLHMAVPIIGLFMTLKFHPKRI